MRSLVGLAAAVAALAAFLPPPATAGDTNSEMKKRVVAIPNGSVVKVKLTDGSSLRGRMGEVNNDGFAMTYESSGKIETRQVSFATVKSVNRYRYMTKRERVATFLLIGATVGASVGVAAAR